jgi:TRAP-type C4-dicarboxylate transport system substrate-binding protein
MDKKVQRIIKECMAEIRKENQTPAMREMYDEVMESAIKEHMKSVRAAQNVTSIALYN